MKDDPCFSCTLAECDDSSSRCAVRRLSKSYYSKLRHGEKHLISEQERSANNFIFHIWKLDRCAEASEGGRPYKRWERETASRRANAGAPA